MTEPNPRTIAASLAVQLEASVASPHDSLERRTRAALQAADQILAWLTTPGPVVRLVGTVSPPYLTSEGNPMANPQVPTTYSVDIAINPEDTNGNSLADTLTWTSSDPTDAPVVVVDGSNTLKATVNAVNPAPGVTVTATDAANNTFVYTFDADADAVVTLVGTVSAPYKTPAPTATPAASTEPAPTA